MNDHDYIVVTQMTEHGGSFVKALANAFHHADPQNTKILKKAFPKYWRTYEKMAEKKKGEIV